MTTSSPPTQELQQYQNCFSLKNSRVQNETRALHVENNACLLFPKFIKGHNAALKPCRVMALIQIEDLVMVNKCIKFHMICLIHF